MGSVLGARVIMGLRAIKWWSSLTANMVEANTQLLKNAQSDQSEIDLSFATLPRPPPLPLTQKGGERPEPPDLWFS